MADSGDVEVRRWLVHGVVQGVGFRMFVLREANRLGLIGTVRNTIEGAVEVTAAGTASQVGQLESQLHNGPEMAVVESVEKLDYEGDVSEFANRFMIVP